MESINLFTVLIGAVIHMALGTLWYSPRIFGKLWMQDMKMKEKDCKPCGSTLGFAFVSALLMSLIIQWIFLAVGVADIHGALAWSTTLWAGFSVTTSLGGVLWQKEPVRAWVIFIGYSLVSYSLIGISIVLLG